MQGATKSGQPGGEHRPEREQIEAGRARMRARLLEKERQRAAGFGQRHLPDVGRGIGYLILAIAILLVIIGVIAR